MSNCKEIPQYNFTINQGEAFQKRLTWKDANGDPIDITGYSALIKIKKKKGDTTEIITLDSTGEDPRITITGNLGRFDLYISAEDTEALNFVDAVYDMDVTASGGEPVKFMAGRVSLNKEV